ncbi:MAG: Ku protein [Gaiellales bacterium]
MRISWNGSLSFGLVSIPVGIAPATKSAARQSDVPFRLLHRECLTPIKQKRWCPVHDCEVAGDDLVKGLEVSKGQFVIIEESELETLERHDDSRIIEISQFVPLEDVDPVWMDRTYFLVPGNAAAQRKPYRLLLQAMRETGTGAIGRFVRSGRESLCLVRPRGSALALETLYLAEDVYSQAEIEEAMAETEVKDTELGLAHQIVEGLRGEFEPSALTSDYRRDLKALIETKLRGEPLPAPAEQPEPAPAVDLLEALRASVEAAKKKAGPVKPRETKASAAKPKPTAKAPAPRARTKK